MKKLIALFLVVLLLCSIAACGVAKENEPEVYVASEDIEVALAAVYGGKAKAVARKLTDKELTSVDFCCVYFDESGKQIGEAEIIQCDFSQDAELSVWTFTAAPSSRYIKATIASVTYADGVKQECPGVSTWAAMAASSFTTEGYAEELEALAGKEAVAAQQCEAVEVTPGTPADSKMELGVKNNSGKEIDEVVAYVLWFDAEGNPVEIDGMFVPNAEKISAKTLAADEYATYTAAAPENAASTKAIVQSVTFTDGEIWKNEHMYEWALVNYDRAN